MSRFRTAALGASATVVAVALLAVTAEGSLFQSTPSVHNDANHGRAVTQTVAPADPSVGSAFAAFRSDASLATPAEQQKLRDQLGGDATAEHGAIAHADFSAARAVALKGSTQHAFIVPSGQDVCVVAPDGDDYGASCVPVAKAKQGYGLITLTPPVQSTKTTAVVAMLVPDGNAAPTAIAADGTQSTMSTSSNVAAAVEPLGTEIKGPASTILLRK